MIIKTKMSRDIHFAFHFRSIGASNLKEKTNKQTNKKTAMKENQKTNQKVAARKTHLL